MTTKPTQISIGQTVTMVRPIGNGPALQTQKVIDDTVTVPFDSYQQGLQLVGPGVSNWPLIAGAQLIILVSDNPIDVTIDLEKPSMRVIENTKRLTIEMPADVTIHVANNSSTLTAQVDFVTVSKIETSV